MLYFYVHETHSRQEEINRRDRGGGTGRIDIGHQGDEGGHERCGVFRMNRSK